MRTGHLTAARTELEQNGYISDETLSRLSAEEIVFVVAQATERDTCSDD